VCVSVGEGNMKLHCCVAAYVSDFALLGTILLPYSKYKARFTASLDHAMWFHSTFRSDEWMLYECESPWAGQYTAHVSWPLSEQQHSPPVDALVVNLLRHVVSAE